MFNFRLFLSIIIIIAFYSINSFSQALNYPESTAYDSENKMFYVSCKAGKQILTMDLESKLSFFASGLVSPRGLLIYNGMLFVADGPTLKRYNLTTKELDINLPLENATMLNDICADSSGHLYITDTQTMVIYKYTPETQAVEVLNIQDIVNSPNGILYDKETNQLIYVEYTDPGAIVTLDLATTQIKKTVVDPKVKYMDGIVKLPNGKFLVSAWQVMSFDKQQGKIYEWDPKSTSQDLVVFAEGYSAPADISVIYEDGSYYLIIPNYLGNIIDFFPLDIQANVKETESLSSIELFPNPSATNLNINLKSTNKSINSISLYNQLGMCLNEIKLDGALNYQIDVQNLESGTYYIMIRGNDFMEKRRFVVLR
jgi:sugar lactone lactonase YvrE